MKTRTIVGLLALVSWLAMMTWLGQREGLFPSGAKSKSSAEGEVGLPGSGLNEQASEQWFRLVSPSGQEAGRLHLRRFPETVDGEVGWATALDSEMRLVLLDRESTLELSGQAWRPTGRPGAQFEFSVESGPHSFAIRGTVEGGELRADLLSAGESFPLTLPMEDSLLFANGFGGALELPMLEPGQVTTLDSFDPMTLRQGRLRLAGLRNEVLILNGEEVQARVIEIESSGLRTQAWVDMTGQLLRADTPLGLRLERSTPPTGATPNAVAAPDLLSMTAIRPQGEIPNRGSDRMLIRLLPKTGSPPLPPPPEDPSQKRSHTEASQDLRFEILSASAPEDADLMPPLAASPELAPPATPPGVARYLRAEALVQSDHPKIRRQAAIIVGQEENPWRKALLLQDWVYTRIEKEAALGVPSALEVLASRRGDCNEHTVLFTALARASGLPTRIAIGLVWSETWKGFYYHAWPEVMIGDWIRMDPTLGQPLADATHIKLLTGGIEQWPRLLPYLGNLEIDILELSRGNDT